MAAAGYIEFYHVFYLLVSGFYYKIFASTRFAHVVQNFLVAAASSGANGVHPTLPMQETAESGFSPEDFEGMQLICILPGESHGQRNADDTHSTENFG